MESKCYRTPAKRNLYRVLPILFAFILCIPGAASGAGIVINELMASNKTTLLDPDFNQFADWIELRNPNPSAAPLAGYSLTDDPANPARWTFPAGVSIPANGFLLIYADGENVKRNVLHANFKLKSGGEGVWLSDASGTAVDSVRYEDQPADVSYGRQGNGSDWVYFGSPTPGTSNGASGLATKKLPENPEFSAPGGLYAAPLSLALSGQAAGSSIRYTTDGSVPTESSTAYGGPIAIAKTTAVRARVYRPGFLPGETVTQTYFVGEDVHLPVVSIALNPKYLTDDAVGIYVDHNIASRKQWRRPASIECFEPDGRPAFKTNAGIQLFGNSAIYIPEKSFDVSADDPVLYPIFPAKDRSEFKSVILRSSSDDWSLTMFRDGMNQLLIRGTMNLDYQAYRPAVVFINGEYWGIHNFREKEDAEFIHAAHGAGAPEDGVDILTIDDRPDAAVPVDVTSGDRIDYDALMDFFANADLSVESEYQRAASWVDLDNFIDWAVLEIFSGNASWRHNIRVWRPKTGSGRWQWIVFDLDRGYGNNFSTDRIQTHTLNDMADNYTVLGRLLANASFRSRFIDRFYQAMNWTFEPGRVIGIIDSLQNDIRAEMPRHIERWKGRGGIASLTAWESNVEAMRAFARLRGDAMREQLRSRFGLSGTAELAIHVSPAGAGRVTVDSSAVTDSEFSGFYLSGTSVPLHAAASPGYMFTGWTGSGGGSESLLVPRGSEWKYRANDHGADAGWTAAGFNDGSWVAGRARLGYGGDGEVTTIPYGSDANNKWPTSYFRKKFDLADPASYTGFNVGLLRDDGAVVYINGREAFRSNMNAGAIAYSDWSQGTASDTDEHTYLEYTVDPSFFLKGTNIVAAEVHQANATSSDLSFDLEIAAVRPGGGGQTVSSDPDYTVTPVGIMELAALFEIPARNRLPSSVVSDTILTAVNSPYVAKSDLVIRPNARLLINAGVEIKFDPGASLIVRGALSAFGRKDKPIRFTRSDPSKPWGALCFQNATDTCALDYLELTGATHGPDSATYKAAISSVNSGLVLDHVTVADAVMPFYVRGGRVEILNGYFDGSRSGDDNANIQNASARIENTTFYGLGELDFDFVDNGVIRGCRFFCLSSDPNRDCVDIGSSKDVIIEDNAIYNAADKGISIGEASQPTTVRGNVISGCVKGIAVKDNSDVVIDGNTIFKCGTGIDLYEKMPGAGGGHATVRNTIFSKSAIADIKTDALSSFQVSYSLSDKQPFQGEGNLYGDPMFSAAAAADFHLRKGSSCINSGSPSSPKDADGSRADMGAVPYNAAIEDFAGIRVNEVMSQNRDFVSDEKGNYGDWIELFNAGSRSVDAGGLYVTDDIRRLLAHRIPSSSPQATTIPAGGFLTVWADGDSTLGTLHVNFKLSGGGETVYLVYRDGSLPVILDSLRFGNLADNESFGRSPDGNESRGKFENPTPGLPNFHGGSAQFHLAVPAPDTLMAFQNPAGLTVSFKWTRPSLSESSLTGIAYVLELKNLRTGEDLSSASPTTSASSLLDPGRYGEYRWRATARLADGRVLVSETRGFTVQSPSAVSSRDLIPGRFGLAAPYPNPFNPAATVEFGLPVRAEVRLDVYDILGKRVRGLVRGTLPPGTHAVSWDGRDDSGVKMSSGLYFVRIKAGNFSAVRKVTLLQ
jgi:parallel beta-helix repeat protein